jgi:hypothetical protein
MTDKDKDEWGNIELPGLSDEELFSKNWNYIAASREKAKDPKYLEKLRSAQQKLRNDPTNKEKRLEVGKKVASDPTWQKNQLIAAQKRRETGQYVKMGESNKERAKTPEWIEANLRGQKKRKDRPDWKEHCLEKAQAKCKPMQTPLGVFPSKKSAAETLKIDISFAMKHKPTLYYYITKEEYERLQHGK